METKMKTYHLDHISQQFPKRLTGKMLLCLALCDQNMRPRV